MNEMNLNWDDLRLFLAISRAGGLAGAANATGKSAPTLGRRMVDLERRLGQELFTRHARGYRLTEDGQMLMAEVEKLSAHIAELSRPAEAAAPLVKVSAGTWVTYFLSIHQHDIASDQDVRLRYIAADEVLNISHREAVIGIRNQRPTQIGLAGRRIGTVRFAVYAQDATVTQWARVIGSTPSARWVAQTIPKNLCVEVTSPRTALDLALAGAAKAVLPTFVGERQRGLSRITQPIEELDHDQWLVAHEDDRHLPEVRQAIRRIYAVLRTGLTDPAQVNS